MEWARILAYITGTVDQKLLLRNEYLAAENQILKAQVKTPLRLTDAERMTLAEIAYRLEPLKLPARSPNLNAYAERWVKSVKEEALSKLILFGETSLRRLLREYLGHYHVERNHQGKDNVLLFPTATKEENHVDGPICCKERLGGLLKYYHQEAA